MHSSPDKTVWNFREDKPNAKARTFSTVRELAVIIGKAKPELLHNEKNPETPGAGDPVFSSKLSKDSPLRSNFSDWDDVWELRSETIGVIGYVDGELPMRVSRIFAEE